MKLKTKLVLMSVAVSSLMCVVITFSAMRSVQGLTASMVAIAPSIQTASSVAAKIEAQAPAQTNEVREEDAHTGAVMPAMATQPATIVEAQRTFRVERVYVMVAIVAVGALFTWLFAGRILRPLEMLTQQVRQTRPETLTQAINLPKTGDEVGRLGRAFEEMAAQVGAAYDLQKSFAASAAHELRTPLSVLNAEVDVYRMEPQHTPEEQAEFARTVHESTQRLTALVEDLLGLTNQSNITMCETVELRTLLEEIVFELTEKAAEKEIALTIAGESFAVTGNDGLLQRAFYNLAENALKYTDAHGSVHIELVPDTGTVQVTDTGYGVADVDKPFIFEPFYRAEKSRSRTAGGSGLGLAIVQQIILRHGGSITVEDNVPRGAVFTVKFL